MVWVLILSRLFQLPTLGWIIYQLVCFWGRDSSRWIFHSVRFRTPNPCVIQWSTLFYLFITAKIILLLITLKGGFPGGAVVENLPASAGDAGSSPGLGGSHMPRSNWAREPQLLSLRVWSLCSATGEAAIVGGPRTAMKSGPRTAMKSGPRLPQLDKALAQKRRPNTAKTK